MLPISVLMLHYFVMITIRLIPTGHYDRMRATGDAFTSIYTHTLFSLFSFWSYLLNFRLSIWQRTLCLCNCAGTHCFRASIHSKECVSIETNHTANRKTEGTRRLLLPFEWIESATDLLTRCRVTGSGSRVHMPMLLCEHMHQHMLSYMFLQSVKRSVSPLHQLQVIFSFRPEPVHGSE